MTLRSRPSRRDHLLAVKGQLDGLMQMAGKPIQDFLTKIPDVAKPRKPSGKRLERDVSRDIREWVQHVADLTLWRNNRGSVELDGGKRLTYGVGPNGASDLIGFRTIVVTQAMVGKRIAQFVAVECKAPGAEPSDDQISFIDRIQAAGGIAGIARSVRDAENIING